MLHHGVPLNHSAETFLWSPACFQIKNLEIVFKPIGLVSNVIGKMARLLCKTSFLESHQWVFCKQRAGKPIIRHHRDYLTSGLRSSPLGSSQEFSSNSIGEPRLVHLFVGGMRSGKGRGYLIFKHHLGKLDHYKMVPSSSLTNCSGSYVAEPIGAIFALESFFARDIFRGRMIRIHSAFVMTRPDRNVSMTLPQDLPPRRNSSACTSVQMAHSSLKQSGLEPRHGQLVHQTWDIGGLELWSLFWVFTSLGSTVAFVTSVSTFHKQPGGMLSLVIVLLSVAGNYDILSGQTTAGNTTLALRFYEEQELVTGDVMLLWRSRALKPYLSIQQNSGDIRKFSGLLSNKSFLLRRSSSRVLIINIYGIVKCIKLRMARESMMWTLLGEDLNRSQALTKRLFDLCLNIGNFVPKDGSF
ncbi:hypothetical protein Tco_0503335 [Tanacetum coccineum]